MKHKPIYSPSLASVLNTPFGFQPISTKISTDFTLGIKRNDFMRDANATPSHIDHIYGVHRMQTYYSSNGFRRRLREQQFEDIFLTGESEIDDSLIQRAIQESFDWDRMSKSKFWQKYGLD